MSAWRRVALETFPERRREIEAASDVMALWCTLWVHFSHAYASAPPDDDTIGRTYAYAWWCLEGPSRVDDARYDAATAAVVLFFDGVRALPAARIDQRRWTDR